MLPLSWPLKSLLLSSDAAPPFGFFWPFVPGACLHPNAQGNGFDMGHGVGQHVQPIFQAGNLNTHNSIPFQAFLIDRTKSLTAVALFGSIVKRSLALSKWDSL